jgi:hypothetical protein
VSEYSLYPGECLFYSNVYSLEDPNSYTTKSGRYAAPPELCVEQNRSFPDENFLNRIVRTYTRCGETLYTEDTNGDGVFEGLQETTYDAQCTLLTEYAKDGNPGFEERALRRQGVATYSPEGWLTSFILTSYSSFFSSNELTQTFDERGNLLTQVVTTPTSETTFSRVALTFTWDSSDRQLTRQEVYFDNEDETGRTVYTYTYEGDWPEPTCPDRLPSATEG